MSDLYTRIYIIFKQAYTIIIANVASSIFPRSSTILLLS